MNFNEVIVNCVIEIFGGVIGFKDLVYLNDYCNMGQFLNDIFLMVMYIVIVMFVCDVLMSGLIKLVEGLEFKFEEFKDIIKIGWMYM